MNSADVRGNRALNRCLEYFILNDRGPEAIPVLELLLNIEGLDVAKQIYFRKKLH